MLSLFCNQSPLYPQCAARSVGAANQAFAHLIQSLMIAQCTISEPSLWPEDYGPVASTRCKRVDLVLFKNAFTKFVLKNQ